MSVIGYIRVSSNKQTCEHQKYEITQFTNQKGITINKWIEETISSRKSLEKRQLGQLLQELEPNDILITTEISRLGRSLLEVMKILEICLSKNCQIYTIKEKYKLGNDIQSQVMAFAFSLSAQIERDLISQRTKCSLDSIRAKGKRLGRPFSAQSKKLKLSKNATKVHKLLKAGISKRKIAAILHVQPMTVARFIQRTGW